MNEKLIPIVPILEDPDVTEILIDGWQNVYVEKNGKLSDWPTPFRNEDEVYAVIEAILEPMGKIANESNPIQDARLQDGSLVNVVIPPIALDGPSLTIRKVMQHDLITPEDMVDSGSASKNMLDFLRACVLSRINMVVSGGTGSGKTVLLNALCRWIPEDERLVLLQNTYEFRLPQKRVVVLETRPANLEGRGEISMQQLVTNATRMRPDRIILTEALGAEIFYMVNALGSGYDGGLLSLHSSSVRDTLARMEVMAGYANPSIPLLSLREQIASAVDVVIHQERMSDGVRRMVKISEVIGIQDGIVATRDLFEFRRTGTKSDKIFGTFTATGAIPSFLEKLQKGSGAYGMELPISVFTPV